MNQQTVFTFAKWQVKQGELEKVLELVAAAAEKSRKEPGNLFYKIYQSSADSHTILLHEAYAGSEGVEAHRNAAHYKELVMNQIIPRLEKREITLTSELAV